MGPPPPRPEIRAFLEQLAGLGAPAFSSLDVATNRAGMIANVREFWGDVDAVAQTKDHVVPAGAHTILVRSHRPAADVPLPGLVFFHGGGWVIGSVDTHDGLCRSLANLAGCVVFSVEYRLAPEHPFPAAAEDAVSALSWICERASDLDVDPSRISVAGDSAGGNLAAVAARKVAQHGVPLASQVLVYPVAGASTETASYGVCAEGYFLTRDDMRWFLGHYAAQTSDLVHPDLAPVLAEDLSGLPRAYIATCELDPLRDEGATYAERLRDAGVDVTHEDWPGMIHGFMLMRTVTPAASELIGHVVAFLRESWAVEQDRA
jgi:acetyl esterase